MKPPAVQNDQIGTSAVDLFASGMGAFILIALVFMVLFAAVPRHEVVDQPAAPECPEPVQCPEPVECEVCPPETVCPEIPEPEPCPECPEQEIPECPEPVLCPEPVECPDAPDCPICPVCPPVPEPPTPAPKPPTPSCPEPQPRATPLLDSDLVFVLDTTGSMRNEIDALKRELHVVVEILERMMPSVAVGIVTFNDRRQSPPGRHYPVRRLTGDEDAMRDIQRFLRSIDITEARGPNPDVPEAILTALRAAATSTFRPGVPNRFVIVITDAYAYEDEVQQTLAVARAFGAGEGHRVSTVHVRQNPDSGRYLTALAEAGGGEFVPDRGSILANVLLSML